MSESEAFTDKVVSAITSVRVGADVGRIERMREHNHILRVLAEFNAAIMPRRKERRAANPPPHQRPVIGHYKECLRFNQYSAKSEQARRGIVGRWQRFNGHGWENCEEPDSWEEAQEESK